MPTIYDIPISIYDQLSSEQQALLKLLDDPDDGVFEHVQNGILDYGSSMLSVMALVFDYASVNNLDILKDRTASVQRRSKIRQIEEYLKYSITLERYIEIIISIDEMVLLRNLEKDFILDELENMRRQLWLNMNFYMPDAAIATSIHSIYYDILSFKEIDENSKLSYHTFIHTFYNRQASGFMQMMTFGILADMMNVNMNPIIIDGKHILGLTSEMLEEYIFLISFPEGVIYKGDDIAMNFSQQRLKFSEIAEPGLKYRIQLAKYVDFLMTVVNPDDQSLIDTLGMLRQVLSVD